MEKITDQPLRKCIGIKIKQMRIARSISQEELAELAGVHRTYIGMIERGEKNITVLSLQKIVKALDVSLSNFFEEIENG